jgi:hypothetical protein
LSSVCSVFFTCVTAMCISVQFWYLLSLSLHSTMYRCRTYLYCVFDLLCHLFHRHLKVNIDFRQFSWLSVLARLELELSVCSVLFTCVTTMCISVQVQIVQISDTVANTLVLVCLNPNLLSSFPVYYHI